MARRARAGDKEERITILVWAANYLAPFFLLAAPYLGLRVNPSIHFARTIQIALGLGLIVFETIWYGLRVMRQSDALRTVRDIRFFLGDDAIRHLHRHARGLRRRRVGLGQHKD